LQRIFLVMKDTVALRTQLLLGFSQRVADVLQSHKPVIWERMNVYFSYFYDAIESTTNINIFFPFISFFNYIIVIYIEKRSIWGFHFSSFIAFLMRNFQLPNQISHLKLEWNNISIFARSILIPWIFSYRCVNLSVLILLKNRT